MKERTKYIYCIVYRIPGIVAAPCIVKVPLYTPRGCSKPQPNLSHVYVIAAGSQPVDKFPWIEGELEHTPWTCEGERYTVCKNLQEARALLAVALL